jgi:hypothetical protein
MARPKGLEPLAPQIPCRAGGMSHHPAFHLVDGMEGSFGPWLSGPACSTAWPRPQIPWIQKTSGSPARCCQPWLSASTRTARKRCARSGRGPDGCLDPPRRARRHPRGPALASVPAVASATHRRAFDGLARTGPADRQARSHRCPTPRRVRRGRHGLQQRPGPGRGGDPRARGGHYRFAAAGHPPPRLDATRGSTRSLRPRNR